MCHSREGGNPGVTNKLKYEVNYYEVYFDYNEQKHRET